MHTIYVVMLLIAISVRGEPRSCNKISPYKNTDWTELLGSWYHLLHIPGASFFLTCKHMSINDVDLDSKIVNVEFSSMGTYNNNPRLLQHNSVYFKWETNKAVIYTGLNTDRRKQKISSKFSLIRKLWKTELKSIYTLISTDYKNYMIMVQCTNYAIPNVWISIKNLDVDDRLADSILRSLSSAGLNASNLNFNSTEICSY
ncbi:uncharacterized protein LOC120343298 [Styela clava]